MGHFISFFLPDHLILCLLRGPLPGAYDSVPTKPTCRVSEWVKIEKQVTAKRAIFLQNILWESCSKFSSKQCSLKKISQKIDTLA